MLEILILLFRNLLGVDVFSLIFLDIVLVNLCQPTSLQEVTRGYKGWQINELE